MVTHSPHGPQDRTPKQLARELNVSLSTVYRHKARSEPRHARSTRDDIKALRESGLPLRDVALLTGVSLTSVWRLLHD